MSDRTSQPLAGGLVFEAPLPLRWTRHEAATHPGELALLEHENQESLRVMLAVDEHHAAHTADDTPFGHEVARLDSKLDLLLQLVAQLLARHSPPAERVPVRLGARSIEWEAAQVPAQGNRVLIEVYPNPKFPCPLVLSGRVQATRPAPAGQSVTVAFEHLGDAVREELEKFIFRAHRRHIAHARRTPPGA